MHYNSVTKFITMIANNLATPKAAAKLELLFNKLASGANGMILGE
jgi:hypothetical protein